MKKVKLIYRKRNIQIENYQYEINYLLIELIIVHITYYFLQT